MAINIPQIPERRDPWKELMGQGMQAAQVYGAGKTFGMWGQAPVAGTPGAGAAPAAAAPEAATGGVAPAAEATGGTYTGSTFAAPTATPTASPAASAGLDWGAGESAGSALGPISVGAGGMAFGAIANNDYQMHGSKAGNAPYASNRGPALQSKPNEWGMGEVSRRLSADNLTKSDIFNARKTVDLLPLSDMDKGSMFGKLGKMMDFFKGVKVG